MDLRAFPTPFGAAQNYLMRESAHLVGAAAAVMVEVQNLHPGSTWQADRFDEMNLAHAREMIQNYLRSSERDDPCEVPLLSLSGAHVVATRQQLVDDKHWYESQHVNRCRRAMRMDHCVYSLIYRPRAGTASCLCLFREWGDKTAFSTRDAKVLEVLHFSWFNTQKRPTLDASPAPSSPVSLTPRLQEVLELLLDGLTEREIGERLGVSVHTVHAHIVALYRKYNVSSRAKLMARTMRPTQDSAPPSLDG